MLRLLTFGFAVLLNFQVALAIDEEDDDIELEITPEQQALESALVKVQRALARTNSEADEADFQVFASIVLMDFELEDFPSIQARLREELGIRSLEDIRKLEIRSLETSEMNVLKKILPDSPKTNRMGAINLLNEISNAGATEIDKDSAKNFTDWQDLQSFEIILRRFSSRIIEVSMDANESSVFVTTTRGFSDQNWADLIAINPQSFSALLELQVLQEALGLDRMKSIANLLNPSQRESLVDSIQTGPNAGSEQAKLVISIFSTCASQIKSATN